MKKQIKAVKIIMDDDTEYQLEGFEHGEISLDEGIHEFRGTNFMPDIRPNGHRRVCIRLWSGCQSFDDFIPMSRD